LKNFSNQLFFSFFFSTPSLPKNLFFFFFKETIVGVNKYRLKEEDPIEVLAIDNTFVRQKQVSYFFFFFFFPNFYS